jgi:hypothetical protein
MTNNDDNDSKKNYDKSYWTNLLVVTGILAGITFSSLLILIEAKNNIISPDWFPWKNDYFEMLVIGMSIVSIFFITSAAYQTFIATYGSSKLSKGYSKVVDDLFLCGFFGLMVMIPLLVSSFSVTGAIILIILEIIINLYLIRQLVLVIR